VVRSALSKMADEYSSTAISLRVSFNKLSKLRGLVGVGDGRSVQEAARDEELAQDERRKLAQLTPYQRTEYLTANAIQELRETMRTYEEMENGIPRQFGQAEVARCRQRMRKQEIEISKMGKDALRLARQEKKESDARELLRHVDGAKQYYRQRFRLVTTGGDGSNSDADRAISPINSATNFGRNDAAPLLSSDSINATGFGTSLRSESEFQQFFSTLMKQDHLMESQLDRIHAGILRLRDNADTLSNELNVQDALIDDTEAKVDAVTGKLKSVNKTLKATLKQVESSRMCMYVFCCLILAGLVGGILYVTGVIGPSSKQK
jgi:syntaxin of plants SYP7